MLIALFILSLLGAGAYGIISNDEFGFVEDVIEEPVRAERALMIMHRINRLGDQFEQQRGAAAAAFAETNKRHNTNAKDYEIVFDKLWQARAETLTLYRIDVFQLRATMTRREWQDAFEARRTAE